MFSATRTIRYNTPGSIRTSIKKGTSRMSDHSLFHHLGTNIPPSISNFFSDKKMHVPIVSSVLLLTLFVVHGDPQFRRYMAPYAPSFHDYPFHPHYPSFRDYPEIPQPVAPYHQPRFYFLEKTVVVSSTTNTIYNCRYSTAVLRACRRRRSVEEDAEFIDPSAVAR